jgi:hypothetical protein
MLKTLFPVNRKDIQGEIFLPPPPQDIEDDLIRMLILLSLII